MRGTYLRGMRQEKKFEEKERTKYLGMYVLRRTLTSGTALTIYPILSRQSSTSPTSLCFAVESASTSGLQLLRDLAHAHNARVSFSTPPTRVRGTTNAYPSASAHSTYYDRRLRQGPALIRARRPYLFRNSITGLGLLTVVAGICMLHVASIWL